MKKRLLVLVGSFLAGAACSDGPAAPGSSEPSASFTYQGPLAGTFLAVGKPRLDRTPLSQTYAHGLRYPDPASIEVSSILQRPDNLADALWVNFPRQSAGSVAIDTNTCPAWDDACPSVSVALGLPTGGIGQAKYSCRLETGSIRVASITEDRVTGEFSGRGTCTSDSGQDIDGFTVTDGRFDVILLAGTRG